MRRNLKNEIRACENDMKIHQAQISRKHGILESCLPCWIVKRVEEDGSDKKGGRCYIYTEAQVTNTVKKHFKRRIFFYTLIPLLGTKQHTKQRENILSGVYYFYTLISLLGTKQHTKQRENILSGVYYFYTLIPLLSTKQQSKGRNML